MKHLHLYNEAIDTDTAYDYEYHSTEEGEVEGDKFTTYYYVFTTKDGDKYYVSLSYFDFNPGSFTADFQDEETFVKDRKEGKDFLTYTYINTNKFDAFKVITTVFKIIKDLILYIEKQPDSILVTRFLNENRFGGKNNDTHIR